MRILVLRGISGSGKSTFARKLAEGQGWFVVSRDELRLKYLETPANLAKYFEGGLDYLFEKFITEELNKELARHIRKNHNIIIDNTNLKKQYIQDYVEIFADLSVPIEDVEIVNFDVDLEVCLERVRARIEKPVSEEVLRRQAEQYQSARNLGLENFYDPNTQEWITKRPRRKWYYTNFEVEPYEPNEKLPEAYIFDIDGTVAHRRMRLEQIPHVLRPYYGDFDCKDDVPDRRILRLIEILSRANDASRKIIFLSGREDGHMEETKQFIEEHTSLSSEDYELFMRKEGDERNDAVIKYELFKNNIENRYNVIGVFDDRKRVVAMWEEMGIKTFNVGSLNEDF